MGGYIELAADLDVRQSLTHQVGDRELCVRKKPYSVTVASQRSHYSSGTYTKVSELACNSSEVASRAGFLIGGGRVLQLRDSAIAPYTLCRPYLGLIFTGGRRRPAIQVEIGGGSQFVGVLLEQSFGVQRGHVEHTNPPRLPCEEVSSLHAFQREFFVPHALRDPNKPRRGSRLSDEEFPIEPIIDNQALDEMGNARRAGVGLERLGCGPGALTTYVYSAADKSIVAQ